MSGAAPWGGVGILVVLCAGAGHAHDQGPGDVRLTYRGFVAGAPVGEATVTLSVRDGRYRVSGDARSNGVLTPFSAWRNRFSAEGRLEDARAHPETFAYAESDGSKTRRVLVRDGRLQVIKNGKARPARVAPTFPDVLSALFVAPRCDEAQMLHTGRHVYRLSRLARASGSCRYSVVDDDEDRFELDLRLVRHEGLTVPETIVVRGWLTGRIELVAEGGSAGTERQAGTAR